MNRNLQYATIVLVLLGVIVSLAWTPEPSIPLYKDRLPDGFVELVQPKGNKARLVINSAQIITVFESPGNPGVTAISTVGHLGQNNYKSYEPMDKFLNRVRNQQR